MFRTSALSSGNPSNPKPVLRQDIPTTYWLRYGQNWFKGIVYTLTGPLSTSTMKTACHETEKQTFCFFTKGWPEFVRANELKLGDTLLFERVDYVEFQVSKI